MHSGCSRVILRLPITLIEYLIIGIIIKRNSATKSDSSIAHRLGGHQTLAAYKKKLLEFSWRYSQLLRPGFEHVWAMYPRLLTPPGFKPSWAASSMGNTAIARFSIVTIKVSMLPSHCRF